MKENEPLISIIIPVYNGEKYLSNCIDSVLSQSIIGKIEIVLVDDGSKDNSYAICKDYSERFLNIKIVQQNNGGVTHARKSGVIAAAGQWISFLDADDSLPNDAIAILYNACNSRDTDIVIGCVSERDLSKLSNLADCRYAMILGKYIFPSIWGKLFKKDLFDDSVFDIPRQITKGEDLLMNIRLLFRTEKPPVFVCKSVYNYRRNKISVSHKIKPTIEGAELYDNARLSSIPQWAQEKYLKATVFNRLNGLTGIAYANPKSLCDKSSLFLTRLKDDIKRIQYKMSLQEWLLLNIKSVWMYRCVSFFVMVKNSLCYRLGLNN